MAWWGCPDWRSWFCAMRIVVLELSYTTRVNVFPRPGSLTLWGQFGEFVFVPGVRFATPGYHLLPLRGGFRDDDPDRGELVRVAPEESASVARGGSSEKEKAIRGRAGQLRRVTRRVTGWGDDGWVILRPPGRKGAHTLCCLIHRCPIWAIRL